MSCRAGLARAHRVSIEEGVSDALVAHNPHHLMMQARQSLAGGRGGVRPPCKL